MADQDDAAPHLGNLEQAIIEVVWTCQHATVRETGTGAQVSTATIPLGAGDPGCRGSGREYSGDYPNPNLWLQWSGDGSRLLMADQAAGTMQVWSVRRPSA